MRHFSNDNTRRKPTKNKRVQRSAAKESYHVLPSSLEAVRSISKLLFFWPTWRIFAFPDLPWSKARRRRRHFRAVALLCWVRRLLRWPTMSWWEDASNYINQELWKTDSSNASLLKGLSFTYVNNKYTNIIKHTIITLALIPLSTSLMVSCQWLALQEGQAAELKPPEFSQTCGFYGFSSWLWQPDWPSHLPIVSHHPTSLPYLALEVVAAASQWYPVYLVPWNWKPPREHLTSNSTWKLTPVLWLVYPGPSTCFVHWVPWASATFLGSHPTWRSWVAPVVPPTRDPWNRHRSSWCWCPCHPRGLGQLPRFHSLAECARCCDRSAPDSAWDRWTVGAGHRP